MYEMTDWYRQCTHFCSAALSLIVEAAVTPKGDDSIDFKYVFSTSVGARSCWNSSVSGRQDLHGGRRGP